MTPAPQPVTEPTARDAIFLVLTVNAGEESRDAVRAICGDLAGLVRAVGQRDVHGQLSCVVAFGSDAWDRLFGLPRPAELHTLPEIGAVPRLAVSTPADVLLHIRAERMDLCFELALQIMSPLGGAVTAMDEVHGFRYFDDRDLTGFVDGTENPVGEDAVAATIVGDEDPPFAGGSYVLVQRYVHDLAPWDALTTYARSPRVLEQMLENMFVGRPPGNYDRLLDFTHAVTGSSFFAPPLDSLEALGG